MIKLIYIGERSPHVYVFLQFRTPVPHSVKYLTDWSRGDFTEMLKLIANDLRLIVVTGTRIMFCEIAASWMSLDLING